MAISALDDPIVSGGELSDPSSGRKRIQLTRSDCLPFNAIESSSHLVLAAVPHGGHLGWFDGDLFGPDRHRRWHVKPVLEFLQGALDELGSQSSGSAGSCEPLQVKEAGGWKWAEGAGWQVAHPLDNKVKMI